METVVNGWERSRCEYDNTRLSEHILYLCVYLYSFLENNFVLIFYLSFLSLVAAFPILTIYLHISFLSASHLDAIPTINMFVPTHVYAL